MAKKFFAHRLFKNTSALLIMKLFTYVAPFIVLPFLSRILGADGFGLMVAALSLIVIANICTDYGFDLSATYVISRKQKHSQYISRVISAIYGLKFLILLVVFVGVGIYLFFAVNYTKMAMAAVYLAIFSQAFISPWLFQGIEKMKNLTYVTIVSRLLYVALIILFVKERDDYDVALACNAVSLLVAGLLANFLIYKEGFSWSIPSWRLVKLMFVHSSQFFLSRVALQANSSISVLVLNMYVTPAQLGLYGASDKIFNAYKSLISPFSQALYPYMANTKNMRLLYWFTALIGFAMLLPAAIGFYFSEVIMTTIFGKEFVESAEVLRIFIITGYFSFFSICLGYPAFAAVKRVDLANKSVILGGGAQIVFLVLLAWFGQVSIVNVAYSVLISTIIIMVFRILWLAKVIVKRAKYE